MTHSPAGQPLITHHAATVTGERQPRFKSSTGSRVPSFPRTLVPPFPRPAGFTLIELLVVITVIAILAGLVTPMVFRNVGDAKAAAARAQIETLGLALDTYRLHNDIYPSTQQGLQALVTLPTGDPEARNWRGPYLKQGVPLDPWGRAYLYRSPGDVDSTGYDLSSLGRDGQPGGSGEDGDVTSWGAGSTAVGRYGGTAVGRYGGRAVGE